MALFVARLLRFQARAMVRNVQVGRSCREVRQRKELQRSGQRCFLSNTAPFRPEPGTRYVDVAQHAKSPSDIIKRWSTLPRLKSHGRCRSCRHSCSNILGRHARTVSTAGCTSAPTARPSSNTKTSDNIRLYIKAVDLLDHLKRIRPSYSEGTGSCGPASLR